MITKHEQNRIAAQIKGLVNAIYADFTEQIAPALPANQKYNAAMMKRRLEILAAHLRLDNEQQADSRFTLSGQPFSRSQFARALRDRQDIAVSSDKLREDLKSDVMHRRWLANPKALSKPE